MPTYNYGERRRHERAQFPQLYLRIGGRVFHTVEWSMGGFLIEDHGNYLPTGALLRIDGLVGEDNYRRAAAPEAVDIRARVVRADTEKGQAALSCLKLDDAAYRIMTTIRDDAFRLAADPV